MKYAVWVLNNIEEILGGALYLIIVSIVSIEVILRYVLDSPIAWTDELATTAFVWVVFLGASSAIKGSLHVGVDVLTNLMPRRSRDVLAILVNLILLWLLYRFVSAGWEFSLLGLTSKVTPMLRIPYAYVDLAVPIGSALMMVRVTQVTIRRIRDLRNSWSSNTAVAGAEE